MNTLINQAEKVDLSYLKQQGLTLIKKNYQTRLGEIDLIIQDGKVLCL